MIEQSRLQQWISRQIVGDEMKWKGAFGRQMEFIRDTLVPLVGYDLDYEESLKIPSVVSTHRSKSIELPVVEMARPDLGLRFIVRNNFYNWKLSVISDVPIHADFDGLFHTTPPIEPEYTGNELSPCYFEGFPEDLIFGYYVPSDKCRFSAEIRDDYQIWTTLWTILRSKGIVKPLQWDTKVSFEKVLAERASKDKARRDAAKV